MQGVLQRKSQDLFSNYVQLGSTSFSEVLKGRKATKEQQLQRAEQFKLKAKEMFAQKHVNEKVEQDKAFWNDAQAKIADENKRMCKLMFGTEKVEDWELRDGSKLSAMAVAIGVLNSKEVGNPNIYLRAWKVRDII